jgi:hypothetical protein
MMRSTVKPCKAVHSGALPFYVMRSVVMFC